MSKSYIPSKDADLVNWAQNFSTVLTAAPTDYGSTSAAAAAISTAVGTFVTDFGTDGTIDRKAVNPATRTKAGVAALKVAKAAMLGLIRPVALAIINSATVTDEQKTTIGVTVKDKVKTVIAPPTTYPNITLLPAGSGLITLRYADNTTPTSKAKPSGVTGLQLFAATSATVITDAASIPFSEFITKQPMQLERDNSEKGKTLYVVGRWQNAKGESGPYGPIVSVIVP